MIRSQQKFPDKRLLNREIECLSVLLTFIVRRAICGLTTKNYNKFFLSALRHLESKGFSRENIVKFLTAQGSESARLPDRIQNLKEHGSPLQLYGRRLTPLRVSGCARSD